MDETDRDRTWELLGLLFQAHPWHGVPTGADAPNVVTAYVEIAPTDTVKYEIDKASGHLKVDRPQQFSNVCPTLYGFIPRTFCGERVAAFSHSHTDLPTLEGDGDPMDGLRLIDRGQADDKIIAVLKGDAAFGHCREIQDIPDALIERLKHYFLTYKRPPEAEHGAVQITDVYGRAEACEVIERSREDYRRKFPELKDRMQRPS